MCKSKTLLTGFLFLVFAKVSSAQNFAEVTGTPFTGVAQSSIAFADVDGDNDQDILITGLDFDGQPPGVRIAKLYTNDGAGNFTEVLDTPFEGVEEGSIAFADVDGDNDQDVLITGRSDAGYSAKLYTNDGSGNFTEAIWTPFQGVNESSIAFADVDGDNDQDVLITGIQVASPVYIATARLYINDGSGSYTEMLETPFDGVRDASIAFADVDGDNDQDVLITGNAEPNGYISKLYTNDGAGGFTEVIGTPFYGVHGGAMAFADVDGDNDPDALITGSDGFESSSKLYINDGLGNFTEVVGTPFPGLEGSAIAFADVDCDGDLDLLMSGGTTIFTLEYTGLYLNDGSGIFTEATDTPFEDLVNGSVAFADVDGDNDPDVLITGQDPVFYVAILYLNACDNTQNQVCDIDYTLGPDATLNCGETTTLSAPDGYAYLWNTGETTQSIQVDVSGTYSCTISETQQTVVVNGDFSNGINDFGTDYAPGTGGAFGLLSAAGQYAVAASPSDVHTNFLSCFDQTVGDDTGSMLILNGSDLPDSRVWFQTVNVTPNTDYEFSFWAMPVAANNTSLPELFMTVDGNQVGATFFLPDNSCEWQNYSTIWNSGANTSIEIAIGNQSSSPNGNDFAIDDIELSAVCEFTDEIEITVPPIPEISVDADTSICAGENIVLTAESDIPGSTFTWQPGDLTGSSIAVSPNVDTQYFVVATSPQNCVSEPQSLEVAVFDHPNIDISGPVEICPGEEAILTATAGNFLYTWNTGDNTNSTSISNGGNYSVDVTDLQSGCQSTAVHTVANLPLPGVTLTETLELCEKTTKEVVAFSDNNSELVWQDGTVGGNYTVTSEGTYTVSATTVCGTIFESMEVTEVNCEQTLFIPNAFTPNGDGINDIFKAIGQRVVSFDFKIYNRWGNLIFSSNDIGEGWNGSYNNNGYYVENGAYPYIANVEYLDGSIETYRGMVNVIR
jgi:gliding motility-associated-like protein